MSTTSRRPSLPARSVLFPKGGAEGALALALRRTGLLAAAATAAAAVLGTVYAPLYAEAARALNSILDADVVGALLSAWATQGALLHAARTSAAEPGKPQRVALATQNVAWTDAASVDLYVNAQHVRTLEVELTLAFQIATLAAKLEAGRITAVESGACQLTASLAVDHLPPLASRSIPFGLRAAIPVKPGIVLVDTASTRR
jgi:hypothetical protein